MALDTGRYSVVLIVAVGLCLGFPVWWKTTEVHRASLPKLSQEMSSPPLLLQTTLNIVFVFDLTDGLIIDGTHSTIWRQMRKALSKQSLLMDVNGSDSPSGSMQLHNLDQVDLKLTHISPTACSTWKNNSKQECQSRWDESGPSVFRAMTSHEQDEHLLLLATNLAEDNNGYAVFVVCTEAVISEGQDRLQERSEGIIGASSGVSNLGEASFPSIVGKHKHAWLSIPFANIEEKLEALVVPRVMQVARHMVQGATQPDISSRQGVKPEVIPQRKPSSRPDTKSFRSAQRQRMKVLHQGPLPLAADGSALLSFSLLNADPADWVFDWDFATAERELLAPLVARLTPVADLAVESQVLYYARGQVRPTWDPRHQAHTLPASTLPFFVNSHEWHLDTSIAAAGRSKLIHLVVYVPAADECPLHFTLPNGQLSPTDGFTVPSWGGVVVWNPPKCSKNVSAPAVIPPAEVRRLLGVQIGQIRTLFGLPAAPKQSVEVQTLSPGAAGFAGWEVATLTRRRAAADVGEALSTLHSLSKLVSELSNMVVQDSIADQMESALAAASEARGAMLTGAYEKAAVLARTACAQAESAFFHPSLVSLLYFPSEHHLAIYMPLFLPVLVNVCAALFRETLSWGRARCTERLSQALSTAKRKHS